MAEKRESECTSTYCHIMKEKPWRAALFDWQFENQRLSERGGVSRERLSFVKMLKRLNFTIYKEESIKETRSLSKTNFLKELQTFKELCVSESCGCILLTISSHGKFVKADDQRDGGDLELFEDCIGASDGSSKAELVPLKEIIKVFRDENLKQIPKIFFIQACRGKDVDVGYSLSGNEKGEQDQHYDYTNRAPSIPYLENSIMVYSTPFGYAAGSDPVWGSLVWIVLMETLDKILTQVQHNGPVNLLYWLKETNRVLATSEFEMRVKKNSDEKIPYKPILSICHTLTRQIVLKKVG